MMMMMMVMIMQMMMMVVVVMRRRRRKPVYLNVAVVNHQIITMKYIYYRFIKVFLPLMLLGV